MAADATTTCPSCGARASGRFCSSCGHALGASHCAGCGKPVAAGARFCSGCGAPVAATGATPPRSSLSPATLAGLGLAVVVCVAAVVWFLGRQGGATPPAAEPQAAIAPDISNMTPREQFQRLADRVQTAVESGDRAQVTQFLPMVEGAYQNLLPGDRDIDARFHIALLRAQTGNPDGAKAEIDTILTTVPDHLFGHYLTAVVADIENRTADGQYDAHLPLLQQFRQAAGGTP